MKIMNNIDMETLQIDLDRLGDGTAENAMKINPGNSKAVSFTRTRVKDPLHYFGGKLKITEASSCKYLGIILRRDLSWVDQVNPVHKAWKGLPFIMRVLLKRSSNTKSLAYMSLVCPILEYGASSGAHTRKVR